MAAAAPSPLLAAPQLADFYVHHHFLQFARLYHAALTGPAAASAASGGGGGGEPALRACRGHLGVLLEMAARAQAGGGARRRFLQLHVLDFLLRELSLEHSARHRALLSSRTGTSAVSTPASTARQLSSRRTSRGVGVGGGAALAAPVGYSEPVSGWNAAAAVAAAGGAVLTNEVLSQADEPELVANSISSSRSRLAVATAPASPMPPSGLAAPRQPDSAPGSPLQQGSPFRGRRLVLTAVPGSSGVRLPSAPGAAAGAQVAEASSSLNPRPPEGPKPACVSPPRKRPSLAVPALSVPLREQQQLQPPEQPQPEAATALYSSPPLSPAGSEHSTRSARSWGDGPTPEPPEPTGDMSEDLAAIEEWEERTGRVYEFQGLSDAEDEVADDPACGVFGDSAGAASPSPSPDPAAGARGQAVPRLALGSGGPPAQLHTTPLLAGGGWAALAAAAGSPPMSPGADSHASSGSSSYKPGYDLEEDFMRGYIPEGLDSRRTSASSGGRIPAGRDIGGEAGEQLLDADAEWGSSSGDDDDEGAAFPGQRTGVVPSLNLSGKAQTASLSAAIQQRQEQEQEESSNELPLQQLQFVPRLGGIGEAADAAEPPPMQGAADPRLATYRGRREAHTLYHDLALHHLFLRLVAALILTPDGQLDPLVLPKDTTDTELQQHVLVLQDHLSHPDNAPVLARLLDGGSGGCSNGGAWARGLRRLLKLTAAGLFDGGRYARERDGQLASGAYGSMAKGTVGGRLLSSFQAAVISPSQNTLLYNSPHHLTPCTQMSHPALPRPLPVVIKSVTLNADASAHNASNFEKVFAEVSVLEALAGTPGVVPLIDYGLAPDCSAFQLVFPRYGSSLAEWRRAQGARLDAMRVRLYLAVFLQMAEAVRKLHAAGIVHYDVKGDNFLTAPLEDAAAIEEAVAALARHGACGPAATEQPCQQQQQQSEGSGSSSGGAASGPPPRAACWPPRPPEQQPAAGGPRRPSTRAVLPTLASCDAGGGSPGTPAACGGVGGGEDSSVPHEKEEGDEGEEPPVPFALVLADFGESVIFGGGRASGGAGSSNGGGVADQRGGEEDGGTGAGAPAAAFVERHRGSAAFMSPEMHMLGSGTHSREHAHYDRRRLRGVGAPHDVWSLGCCLYELVAGRAPFAEEVRGRLMG
jgi:serine/threonine protein kinase